MEHAHGVARRVAASGFAPTHDVPVVVRERPHSATLAMSLMKWREFATHFHDVAPPTTLGVSDEAFATLGSSHLFAALRMIESGTKSVFDGEKGDARVMYAHAMERDEKLRDAIANGLPSVVLRWDTPTEVRARISRALNAADASGFYLDRLTGDVVASDEASANVVGLSVFDALSRTLDSEELSSLARIKYGLSLEESQSGYAGSTPRARL